MGSASAFAQLSENFDATAGVALPAGWTEYNQDGSSSAAAKAAVGVDWGTHGFISVGTGGGNRVAACYSYGITDVNDDWLITPQQTIPTGASLTWQETVRMMVTRERTQETLMKFVFLQLLQTLTLLLLAQ